MEYLNQFFSEFGADASIVSDGLSTDCDTFIDTGSYILNALLSSSIFKGLPGNKITAIAGEAATGKTYFSLGIVKSFLEANPEGAIFYFDSEGALTTDMFSKRGADPTRIVHLAVYTVQDFRTKVLSILDKYEKQEPSERRPFMFVLDSLGMLSTTKEVEDSTKGSETRDMTRTQVIKSTFRIITPKLAKLGIPMIFTNHTYDVVGSYVPMKEMGGGSGLKYSASTIIYLSKSKEKDGKEVIGNIIKCKAQKSRFTKENSQVEVRLYYDRGLDKYYGLLELGEKHGIFTKSGTRYEIGGNKLFAKSILEDPEKYFTEEIMKQLDEAAHKEFSYGTLEDPLTEEE